MQAIFSTLLVLNELNSIEVKDLQFSNIDSKSSALDVSKELRSNFVTPLKLRNIYLKLVIKDVLKLLKSIDVRELQFEKISSILKTFEVKKFGPHVIDLSFLQPTNAFIIPTNSLESKLVKSTSFK